MKKGRKEQIIEKLVDVAIALEKLKKHDCTYYIDEIIENVATSISEETNGNDLETGTKTKAKTREIIEDLVFELSEISDELDLTGLSGDAVVLDKIRNRMLKEFNL